MFEDFHSFRRKNAFIYMLENTQRNTKFITSINSTIAKVQKHEKRAAIFVFGTSDETLRVV